MARRRTIDLAVKASDHPPAAWIHREAKVGSHVTVRVGGDFYFDDDKIDCVSNFLFVAGGIGITPLHSIMRHAIDLKNGGCGNAGKLRLLYSAKTLDEMIFEKSLRELKERELLRYRLCLTGSHQAHMRHQDVHSE